MRIRLPASAIKLASLLASWVIRLWLATLNYRFWMDDPAVRPLAARRPCLYVFWHENLLLPTYVMSRQRIAVLISRHHDGELIAQVLRMLSTRAVRGSTARGGARAMREMIRQGRAGHLAITPDGPRGPRRVAQGGAVYLASRAGMPLVPMGFASDRPWRAPSWDRTALPKPGRRACGVFGEPICVPADADQEQLEVWRQRLQAALEDVQTRAEHFAEHGGDIDGSITLAQFTAWDQ